MQAVRNAQIYRQTERKMEKLGSEDEKSAPLTNSCKWNVWVIFCLFVLCWTLRATNAQFTVYRFPPVRREKQDIFFYSLRWQKQRITAENVCARDVRVFEWRFTILPQPLSRYWLWIVNKIRAAAVCVCMWLSFSLSLSVRVRCAYNMYVNVIIWTCLWTKLSPRIDSHKLMW